MPNANFIIAVARANGFIRWNDSQKIERLTLALNSRGEEVVYATPIDPQQRRHVLHLRTGSGKLRNCWKCSQVPQVSAESERRRLLRRRTRRPINPWEVTHIYQIAGDWGY